MHRGVLAVGVGVAMVVAAVVWWPSGPVRSEQAVTEEQAASQASVESALRLKRSVVAASTNEKRVRLEGIVLGADGAVQPDALVFHALEERTQTATTDASGAFALELTSVEGTVVAQHGALVSAKAYLDEDETDFLTLRLEPSVSVAFEVLDADRLTPIADAQITIEGPPKRKLATGQDGRARTAELGVGSEIYEVEQPGYVKITGYLDVDKGAGAAGVELREQVLLRRGVPVSGVVVDARGEAVDGAQLEAVASTGS